MLTADKQKELDSRFRGNDTERLSWKGSPAIQKVLDAICQILAEEYCRIAKDNPETFTTKG